MKLRCPRCQKALQIADKYAGRAIRCPACNRAFTVPKLQTALRSGGAGDDLDLERLAALEKQAGEMEGEELKAAQEAAIAAAQKAASRGDPNVRICPSCQKPTQAKDPYTEVLCSNCWNPIPALVKAGGPSPRRQSGPSSVALFYSGIGSAMAYPIPAIASLLNAAGIAVGAGLVPVAIFTSLTYLMQQSAAGTEAAEQTGDLNTASLMLMGIFALEVFFFSAVAIHTFLDVVRATTVGQEAPPNLSWSPAQWGKSVVAYLVLNVYFAVMLSLVVFLTMGKTPVEFVMETNATDLLEKGGAGFFVGLLIISLGVPMNLVGIALGSVSQGINPVNVAKGIARTHVHYLFLVVILVVYGILFGGAFWAIVHDWFIPKISQMSAGSKEGNLLQVGLALVAWGAVMAFYFYGMYVLARLHGLFARAFRKNLEFGAQ